MLLHKNPAGTIVDITLDANRLAESGWGVNLLSSREWQESIGLRMLPDSLHGVHLPMEGQDREAPDFQAESLHSRNGPSTQNQDRVGGSGRSRPDRPAVGGEGGEGAVAKAKLDHKAWSWRMFAVDCYCERRTWWLRLKCCGGGVKDVESR